MHKLVYSFPDICIGCIVTSALHRFFAYSVGVAQGPGHVLVTLPTTLGDWGWALILSGVHIVEVLLVHTPSTVE